MASAMRTQHLHQAARSARPFTAYVPNVHVHRAHSNVQLAQSPQCRPASAPLGTRHLTAAPSRPQHMQRGELLHVSAAVHSAAGEPSLPDGSVTVILLAGGVGKRMGAAIPKQYLELAGQPIATYSLDTFAAMSEVGEIVIVCDPSWRYIFEERLPKLDPAARARVGIKWALPGAERQDSVANGLAEVSETAQIVAVHDSARPLVYPADAARCMRDGAAVGAAVLGVPVKPTIKEVDSNMNVIKTLVRATLWEVQTPQCIRPALLREGFALVREKGLEVTDDVSIIEAMGLPVKITPGSYTNIKVTTPDDMSVAVGFLDELQVQRAAAAEKQQQQQTAAAATAATAA